MGRDFEGIQAFEFFSIHIGSDLLGKGFQDILLYRIPLFCSYDGEKYSSAQLSSLANLVVRGDDSADILCQSFLQKALVSTSGMGRDVHTLMLSIQHFLC